MHWRGRMCFVCSRGLDAILIRNWCPSGYRTRWYQRTQYSQWRTAKVCQVRGVLSSFFTVKPKHRLGRALFLLQNMFLALVLPNLNRSG